MIAPVTALSFAGVAFLMALSPGPNLLYLASRSACQGRLAGFASLAGVCTGMFVYMLATSAGLSALFVAVPVAYDVVRMAGVAYLLWLAWKAFTSRAAISGATTMAYESPGRLYRRGLATCLLNPRIVVTYSALLPQFIHPSAGSVLGQTLALGVVQIAAAATAHSFVILSASAVASALSRRPLFARARRFLLGTVLLGIAFRIAAERRTAV